MSLYNHKLDLIMDATTKNFFSTCGTIFLHLLVIWIRVLCSTQLRPALTSLVPAVPCTVRCQLSLSIFISPPESSQ